MTGKRPAVGLGVLIMDGTKVLLSQRKLTFAVGTWAPPGGHLEYGESFEACALREAEEETGLVVRDVSLGTVTSTVYEEEEGHYVSILMVAQYAGGQPVSTETEKYGEWQWFEWGKLPQPLFPSLQQAIDAGFNPTATQDGDVQRFKELAARAHADLQNAKARVEREREEMGKFAAEGLLRTLLPTVDNFQRAIRHIPADLSENEWVKGMVATEQELVRRLGDAGLTKMDALGQAVDPHRHDVLLTGEGKAGTVIEVLEDGYELAGKVLRPAKVKVGQ
jgi:8-oxo-dGTP diphosphatase